jgi:hypothetical protein
MSSEDVVVAAVLVFMFALGFFVVYNVSGTVTTRMLGMSQINSSAAAVTALQGSQKVSNMMDYVVFGVFIAVVLGIIITGWFIGGNPIFMGIYFLITVVAVVFSTVLSNVWETVTQSSIFGTTITHFPIANNILLNLPLYIGIVGFVGLVVMFAKPYIYNGGNDQYA